MNVPYSTGVAPSVAAPTSWISEAFGTVGKAVQDLPAAKKLDDAFKANEVEVMDIQRAALKAINSIDARALDGTGVTIEDLRRTIPRVKGNTPKTFMEKLAARLDSKIPLLNKGTGGTEATQQMLGQIGAPVGQAGQKEIERGRKVEAEAAAQEAAAGGAVTAGAPAPVTDPTTGEVLGTEQNIAERREPARSQFDIARQIPPPLAGAPTPPTLRYAPTRTQIGVERREAGVAQRHQENLAVKQQRADAVDAKQAAYEKIVWSAQALQKDKIAQAFVQNNPISDMVQDADWLGDEVEELEKDVGRGGILYEKKGGGVAQLQAYEDAKVQLQEKKKQLAKQTQMIARLKSVLGKAATRLGAPAGGSVQPQPGGGTTQRRPLESFGK